MQYWLFYLSDLTKLVVKIFSITYVFSYTEEADKSDFTEEDRVTVGLKQILYAICDGEGKVKNFSNDEVHIIMIKVEKSNDLCSTKIYDIMHSIYQ